MNHFKAFYTSPRRVALWMMVDEDGRISFETFKDLLNPYVDRGRCCEIYSCGGENKTIWDLLRSAKANLESEEYEDLRARISREEGMDIGRVTSDDVNSYVIKNDPDLVKTWLEEYYSDSEGYLYGYIDNIYKNILDSFSGSSD